MELAFSEEELAFQGEVRDFIREAMPDEIRQATRRSHSYVSKEHTVAWQKILHAKGWVAPAWPVEHGGTGWNAVERFLFDEEYQAANCPRVSPFGFTMVGPVIYTFGNEAQKRRYLPRILESEDLWVATRPANLRASASATSDSTLPTACAN